MGRRMARRALRQSMWLLIAWLLGSGAASALGQGVAMVTDVTGQVTGPSPVTILSEIAADTRMQVDPGGRLVVIYLKSGDEYTFTGPAQIQFRAVEPQVTSGSAPQKRVSPLARGGNVAIKPVAVTQAAFVMRSVQPSARIRLLTLSGAKTLETAPEFRWRGLESGARYRFELNDDTGKLLFETEITGNSLKLPPAVQLREGVTYAWEVSTRGQDGRRYVGAGEFTLAASPVRAQAAALRPAAGTPVSDRVAYAAWLEQMELKDEARKYWKSLAAERPDDARLKALAAD